MLRVSLEVDEPVPTGEPFRVGVIVETSSARATRGISLQLRGLTTLTTNLEDSGVVETFGTWSLALAEEMDLSPGTCRFEASLSLPADAPPSGEGIMSVRYQLDARVKLEAPWIFDGTATRPLAVARPPRAERPPPRPGTASGAKRGKDTLFVELSLDDTAFAPGEAITGAFSLANIGTKRVDAATVSLVPARSQAIGGGAELSVFKSLVGVQEGSAVRFVLPLPPSAPLSFPSRTLPIEQAVLLRVDGSSTSCRIPVVIDTFPPRAGEPAAPLVGQTRWRFAWRDEGRRAGLALEGRELRPHGTLAGEIEATVRPEGNGVRARLRWASLGIDLRIGPRKLLPSGASLVDFDRRFTDRFSAGAREAQQGVAALGPDLRAAILAFDGVELDDTGARLASSASARDPEELRRFLAALEALAAAVVAAERRLPPPSWVTRDVAEAWRAFAAATTGRLHPGRMAVTGAFVEGDRLDLETVLDGRGRPAATRLTLAVDPPSERAAQLPEGADEDLVRAVSGRDRFRGLEVRTDALVLEVGGATADPAALREAVAEMTKLSRRLRGEPRRGPYR